MIAAWMLHQLATALVLALAALAAEALLRIIRRPTRWAWMAGISLALLLPAARLTAELFLPAPDAVAQAIVPGGGGASSMWAALLGRMRFDVADGSLWQRMDVPLLTLWAVLTLAIASWSVMGALRLRRARREWEPRVVEGIQLLVSGRVGPALAGVIRPRVVLPEWALDGDRDRLHLMLAHEEEHLRAGDPWLLAVGGMTTVLVPWSLPTWWMLRRLRLAVEMDCDARVLRRFPDVRGYGALLLDVGGLMTGVRLPLAALGNPPSTLERRIRAMTMSAPRHPRLLGASLGLGAMALTLAACEVPHPTAIAAEPARSVAGAVVLETVLERARPLIIVDGVPMHDGGDLNDIRPDRIARIDVLKGATARAGYGDVGAANGVVLITTRPAP